MATESIETEIDLSGNGPGAAGASTPVGDDQPDLEVSLVDDTPEQDRGRPRRKEGMEPNIPSDEEIETYSKGVQDRIRQMKWEYHEERRAKEQWQREHQAALNFARNAYEENKKLRELVQSGHKTLLETSKSAAETEIESLKKSLQNALEVGNTAEAAELQAKIAGAAARAEAVRQTPPIRFDDADPDRFVQQQQQPPQQERQPQRVQVSQPMQDWMDQNPWFNTNKRMTSYAFGVHDELVSKGIPPESPRYFAEINKAMRETFSQYFEEEDDGDDRRRPSNSRERESDRRTPQRRSAVGVTRAPAGGRPRNRVELTQSQAAVARKLGITNEQYAAEMLRLERENG